MSSVYFYFSGQINSKQKFVYNYKTRENETLQKQQPLKHSSKTDEKINPKTSYTGVNCFHSRNRTEPEPQFL